jgi:hypothetical protein
MRPKNKTAPAAPAADGCANHPHAQGAGIGTKRENLCRRKTRCLTDKTPCAAANRVRL